LGGPVKKIPLLVRFNAADHKDMLDSAATQILAGGADIRVTKADGTTDVPFEIEHAATGANGAIALWVLADSVAQNSATAATFRVYWGKAAATTLSNSQSVFDTANGYLGVWHMNQPVTAAGDTIRDATHGKNHAVLGLFGTGALVPTDTTGAIGIAKKIGSTANAVGAYFEAIDPDSSLSVQTEIGEYTVSGWVNVTTCASGSRSAIISKYMNNNTAGTRQFALQINGGAANWNLTNNPPSLATPGANEFNAHTPCTANEWQHVVGTYKSTTTPTADVAGVGATMKIYVNGGGAQTNAVATQANTASIGRGSPLRISGIADGQRFIRGSVDEVRIAKVARDSDYVRLSYQTQRPTGGTAVAVGATQANGPTPGYAAWSGHRDITINTAGNGANVSGTVTNIPMLIRLDTAEASIIAAANGGNSIRFSKADNLTPLPYEIEHWGTTSAAIWVKVDTVYGSNATQKIRMHWGNAAASSESNGPAVFDTANGYVGAWHLGNAAGTSPRPGSVAGSPAAIVRNGLPPVSGIIGMADTLGNIPGVDPANGGNPLAGRYIDFGRDSAFNNNNYAGFSDFTTGFTFSTWVYATSTAGFTRFIVLGADSSATNQVGHSSRIMFMGNQNQSATQPNFAVRSNGVANYNSPANAYSFNTWNNITVTKAAGASTPYNIYKNGDLLASSANGTMPENVMRNYAWMGRSSAGTDGWFGGKFDNVTLSKVARSVDFVRLSYQNQRAVNAVVNIGPYEYAATVPGNPSGVTAVAGNAEATVSWTAPTSNGGAAITGYKAMAVADTSKACTTTGALTCVVTGLTNGSAYTFVVKASNSVGTGNVSLASDTVRPSALAGFTGRRVITLNTSATGANIPGLVRNFPVLIRLGSAEASILSAANGGASVRFFKSDSATSLPHEIESWSSTAATIWVKVDSVKGNNATQSILMVYGNAGATSTSSGSAVFDTANGYVAVWHLNEASGNVADATGMGNAGTPSAAAPTDTVGLMGRAKAFNGSTNWYQIGTDSSKVNVNVDDAAGLTISAWVNPTSCDARIAAFSKYVNGATPAGRQYALHTSNTTTNWRFTVGSPTVASTEFFADAEGACVTGTWKHIVGTYASAGTPTVDSSVNVRLYVDGVQVGVAGSAGVTGIGTGAFPYIGRIHNSQRYMNGLLDEITVSKVRRDSNWVKLSYESQKLMQAFTNIGVTLPSAPSAPTGVFATGGGTVGTISVTWSAPTSNGGAAITAYTVTSTPGTATCTTAGSGTGCTLTGLTAGQTYAITVTATNSAGVGAASAPVNAVATGISLPGAFTLRMDGARNPYTYRLPTNAIAITEQLTMTVTDVQGKTVWTRTINPAASKTGAITWDGTSSKGQAVSSGMYMVRLRAVMGGQVIEAMQRGVKF